MLEVMRLAKEAGDVGGERRQHFLPLALALGRFDEFAIIAERFELQRSQALGEPSVDQRRLGLGQIDSGVVVDHRRRCDGSRRG